MTIHYNYALMASVAAKLHQNGSVAETLRQAANANKAAIRAQFMGTAAESGFEPAFLSYDKACAQVTAVTMKGAATYDHSSGAMQATELAASQTFT